MSERDLTKFLASRFTEDKLIAQFESLGAERQALKSTARNGGLIAAIVIGLVWARENVENNEWDKAIAKITGTMLSAAILNKALYARDKATAQIMERNAGRFGKWFQGVARTNQFVNRLLNVGTVSLAATVGLSGSGELPSIPFDIIYDIDIDDPITYRSPSQLLLDFGFNIWYRQKPTTNHPEAQSGNVYLGTIFGSPVPIIYGLIKTAFLSNDLAVEE